jgi:hypothetical protein
MLPAMNHCLRVLGPWASALAAVARLAAGERVLFETGFERFEGYDVNKDLAGQNGWIAIGSGGNGVLPGPIDGFNGQVAYVGFGAPTQPDDLLNLFRPVEFSPAGGPLPLVTFRVSMMVFDSTTNAPYFDDFRWSAYNTQEERLFSIDFDNDAQAIQYVLDDSAGFRPTGWSFAPGEPYDLVVTMNLARNRWWADVNGTRIIDGQPITTRGSKLDLNEMDAVWVVRRPGSPGDNFMVFDDYKLTALPLQEVPPRVRYVGQLTTGPALLRVLGEPGVTYAVEQSADLRLWSEVGRGAATSPDGYLDVQDATAPRAARRFYRARSLP